jgi:DNA primase
MIDQPTIDRIMQVAEITEVIGDFVSLKKRGVNYLGLCPFHNEKTPSFTVSPSKGIYKCFGCSKGGNVVNFIMEHEHMSYPEALKYLARKYHIEVEEKEEDPEEVQQKNERESMLVLSAFAQKYYSRVLLEEPDGQNIGLSYLRERGIRRDTIEKFQIGYSLDKRDAFTVEALKNGYKKEFLVRTGLSIEKGDQLYDRFWGRVMFPIHSLSGRVIGFGARTLRSDPKAAKYLNSPESDIYHKSGSLYGIYLARQSLVREDKCFLVEGYTDVISLYQSGIENVVASSGTALTEDQIRLIRRFTPNVTIIYDGDPAGIKASLRGIDLLLEQGMHVRAVPLPEGDDPDSFARSRSSKEFLEYIKDNEQDFIVFKTRLLSVDIGDDPVKKANLITEVVRSVAQIPNQIERSVYLQECSRLMGVKEEILFSETARFRRRKWEQGQRNRDYTRIQSAPSARAPRQENFEREKESRPEEKEIIRLILIYGREILYEYQESPKDEPVPVSVGKFFIDEFENDNLEFTDPTYRLVFTEIGKIWEDPAIDIQAYFVNHNNPEISSLAVDLISPRHELSKIHAKQGAYIRTEQSMLKKVVPETLISFRTKLVKKLISDIDSEIMALQKNGDLEGILHLLEKRRQLDQLRRQLSKDLKRII